MPTLKSIKKRITSVKNTQKVTKVMKMIAAARLRKAQAAALGARSYTEHLRTLAISIAARRTDAEDALLAQPTDIKTIELLAITSDRGLCGGFNTNLMRKMRDYWQEYAGRGVQVRTTMIGRKGRDYTKTQNLNIEDFLADLYTNVSLAQIAPTVEAAIDRFVAGETQQLAVVYNRFKTVLSPDARIEQILPLTMPKNAEDIQTVDYIYEPSADAVFKQVMRRSLIMQVYQALLESIAAEMAARMTAMDSATKNAKEMMDALTMQYNRARQAFITKELMDIVNGSESLKK
jgi:F-type H+-transporting ATPase subunit gamma